MPSASELRIAALRNPDAVRFLAGLSLNPGNQLRSAADCGRDPGLPVEIEFIRNLSSIKAGRRDLRSLASH